MRFEFTCERDNDTGELGWKDRRVTGEAYGPLSYRARFRIAGHGTQYAALRAKPAKAA
jgi:hypothetical protein